MSRTKIVKSPSIQNPSVLRMGDREATWDGICLNFFEEGVGNPFLCMSRKDVEKLVKMVADIDLGWRY